MTENEENVVLTKQKKNCGPTLWSKLLLRRPLDDANSTPGKYLQEQWQKVACYFSLPYKLFLLRTLTWTATACNSIVFLLYRGVELPAAF